VKKAIALGAAGVAMVWPVHTCLVLDSLSEERGLMPPLVFQGGRAALPVEAACVHGQGTQPLRVTELRNRVANTK